MSHQQFFKGKFDAGPYETTMDTSFYNNKRGGLENNRYLGKMHNNIDEDGPLFSPQSNSNMGFNPALNSKYKGRLFNKPLKLNHKRISKL